MDGSKFIKFLSSALHGLVSFTACGLLVVKAAPHVFPHQLCRRLTELKDHSGKIQIPERCHANLKEVLAQLGNAGDESKITLFICSGFSPLSAGSTLLPNGAVIGVPRWFLFENGEDVVNSGITFGKRQINWKSRFGIKVKESLVATNDNIAFLLGHELCHIKDLDFLYQITLAPLWLYATYRLARLRATKRFSPRIAIVDAFVKLLIAAGSYQAFTITNQSIRHLQEFHADAVSADCDLRMAVGGVDYAVKRLKLNTVLRVLQGEAGEQRYTEEGDVKRNYSHPKLSERLRRLEEILNRKLQGTRLT